MDILNELNLGDPENRPFLLQSIHDISMQITQSNTEEFYDRMYSDYSTEAFLMDLCCPPKMIHIIMEQKGNQLSTLLSITHDECRKMQLPMGYRIKLVRAVAVLRYLLKNNIGTG